jgi:hypothetical protein
VADLLAVMAGREYTVPVNADKFTSPGVWDSTAAGGFTHDVTVHDPANGGLPGAVVPYENKPIRHTYDSTSFQISLAAGHLSVLTTAPRTVTVYGDDGTLLA